MATAPTTLEAFNAAADLEAANETDGNENALVFAVEGFGNATVDLGKVHEEVRKHLYRGAVKNYIMNRVSTAESTTKKANGNFDTYEAAMKHDPLQTMVPKPEGERKTVDYTGIIESALKALYSGEIGRRGGGGGAKKPKDPFKAALLHRLATEMVQVRSKDNPDYKYFNATKEIGPDPEDYLEDMVIRNVDKGMDEKTAREYIEKRYLAPVRMLVGQDQPGGKLKDLEFSMY